MKGTIAKVFFVMAGLVSALGAAQADYDKFANRLIFNNPSGGSAPVVWEFDPTSGFTLGKGVDLSCLRADLIFEPDGTLVFSKGRPDEEGCAGTGPMRWALAPNIELGTLEITITDDDEFCSFDIKFGLQSDPLKLTTSCNQAAGHPREFRYFPPKPEQIPNE